MNQSGGILPSALGFLMLFSILALSALQIYQAQMKSYQIVRTSYQDERLLNQAQQQLYEQKFNVASFIEVDSRKVLIEQIDEKNYLLKSWDKGNRLIKRHVTIIE